MRLNIIILFSFILSLNFYNAQTNEGFNYQFVIRDISGVIVENGYFSVSFKVVEESTNNVVWEELQDNLVSNENGLVSTILKPKIDWQKGPFYIVKSYDYNGSFITTDREEIVSVPLAIFARGHKGGDGKKGIKGLAGTNGKDGQKGIQGIQGIKGETGPKGDKGQNGILKNQLLNVSKSLDTLSLVDGNKFNLPLGLLKSLECEKAENDTRFLEKIKLTNNTKIYIPYVSDYIGFYKGLSVFSQGVTGMTATIEDGFLYGQSKFAVQISGTPSSKGEATFNISIGGETCVLKRQIFPQGAVLSCTGSNLNSIYEVNKLYPNPTSIDSSMVNYSGGNGGIFNNQTVASTNVLGLIATLKSGELLNGNGSLKFHISGLPKNEGKANFNVSIGGKTCAFSIDVKLSIGTIGTLNCSNVSHIGELVVDSIAKNVSSTFSYTNGDGGYYNADTISSEDVLGLKAVLTKGYFNKGSGTVSIILIGKPQNAGLAKFNIRIGGETCALYREVKLKEGNIGNLTCKSKDSSGYLVEGRVPINVSNSFEYNGASNGLIFKKIFLSQGIIDMSALLMQDTIRSSTGVFNVYIDNIPQKSGMVTFPLNINGKICSFKKRVYPKLTLTSLDCSNSKIKINRPLFVSNDSVINSLAIYLPNKTTDVGLTSMKYNSTGVEGLTLSLGDTLLKAKDTITFSLKGVAKTPGFAVFKISLGGKECIVKQEVKLPVASINTLNCDGNLAKGDLVEGKAALAVSNKIEFTSSISGLIKQKQFNSTGVSGLIATIIEDTLFNERGFLTLNISGTPQAGGNAVFKIEVGDKTCELEKWVKPGILITATATQIKCIDGKGSVRIDVSGGTPKMYQCSNSEQVEKSDNYHVFKDLMPGVYEFTIVDINGFYVKKTVTINPEPATIRMTATATQIACSDGTGSVKIETVNGNSNITYSSSTGASYTTTDASYTFTGLQSGDHTFTVSDESGCSWSQVATINPAPVTVKLSAVSEYDINNGGTVQLNVTNGTSNYTYYWDHGNGVENISTSDESYQFYGLGNGNYNYWVTDATGCTSYASVNVSQ